MTRLLTAIASVMVVALLAPLNATPAAASPSNPDPTIPGAIERERSGGDLRASKAISSNSAYTRHRITYRSNDLTISGIMNRPRGEGPFPVVILAHGYIDPEVYWSGQGFMREQDWLARNGYVVIHVDYRNHARSD